MRMDKGRGKIHKMLAGKMQAQRKDGWQRDKEEKLHQEKFGKELGLELMTTFGLLSAANEDNNINSDTEFGGKDTFLRFPFKKFAELVSLWKPTTTQL